ncbi:pyrroloquinoline quinone precursor peptide PqqA [Saccharopolyspora sp. NPDC000359]
MMESAAAHPELLAWEAPDFDEVGCAAEVTMYVAQLED